MRSALILRAWMSPSESPFTKTMRSPAPPTVVAFAVAISIVAVAAGANSCTSNLDCSLNGICSGGVCVCDKPWKGESCGVLSYKVCLRVDGDLSSLVRDTRALSLRAAASPLVVRRPLRLPTGNAKVGPVSVPH